MQHKKFISLKDMARKDYGKASITGILGGLIFGNNSNIFLSIIGGVVFMFGLYCGVVWLYRLILKKA
jgi:hypothetical protein